MLRHFPVWCAVVLSSWAELAGIAIAAPPVPQSALEILPSSCVVYAELGSPGQLVDALLEHEVAKQVLQSKEYQQATGTPQFAIFQFVLKLVEDKLGMTWREAAVALTERGVHLAFDPESQGAAVLIRARDEATLTKFRDLLFTMARDDAAKKGKPDPIKSVDYRGITVYRAGDARFCTLGPWLISVNKDDFGKALLDRVLDDPADHLGQNPRMVAARELLSAQPSGWIWADLERLRGLGAAKQLYQEKSDNPLAEILLGGLTGTLRQTPFLVGTIDISPAHVELALVSPHKPEWIDAAREYYFGPDGTGRAPERLQVPETVFSLSAYRDLSLLWLNSADLFVDRIDKGFAEANANLSTLFGGKDFGEDILGAFKPEIQIIAARQDFSIAEIVPAIKVPSFAAVFQFREQGASAQDFRRMYQNLIGFLNIVGAMEGNPQMNLMSEQYAGHDLQAAEFVLDERDDPLAASIHHNFSPSIAFVGDRFVISSTRGLARQLVNHLSGRPAVEHIPQNTAFGLEFAPLGKILGDNRGQFVAQAMLKDGKSQGEAEQQINLLLQGLALLKDLQFALSTEESRAVISLRLSFSPAPEPAAAPESKP